MNNLANLTQKLKLKPRVAKEEVIEVEILPEQPIIGEKDKEKVDQPTAVVVEATEITAEKDNGSTALDLIKRLEARTLTTVGKQLPQLEAKMEPKSKAPILEEEPKKARPKKQKNKA